VTFMERGLWLDVEIEVHGPHDASGQMWGNAWARVNGTGDKVSCVFFAKARRNKYDPVNIRIYEGEENRPVEETDRFTLRRASRLTPQALHWLHGARRAAEKLRRERRDTEELIRELEDCVTGQAKLTP